MRADFAQPHTRAHRAGRIVLDTADFLVDGVLDGFREGHAVGLEQSIDVLFAL